MKNVFDLTALAAELPDYQHVAQQSVEQQTPPVYVAVTDRVLNAIVSYVMWPQTPFALLMDQHCSRLQHDPEAIVFRVGLRTILPSDTPESVDVRGAGGMISARSAISGHPSYLDPGIGMGRKTRNPQMVDTPMTG